MRFAFQMCLIIYSLHSFHLKKFCFLSYVVCMYPDFDEALSHLQKRHVKIYRSEELRGGGLLKYAYLRQNDFRDDPNESSESLRLAINAMVSWHR